MAASLLFTNLSMSNIMCSISFQDLCILWILICQELWNKEPLRDHQSIWYSVAVIPILVSIKIPSKLDKSPRHSLKLWAGVGLCIRNVILHTMLKKTMNNYVRPYTFGMLEWEAAKLTHALIRVLYLLFFI